MALDSATGFPAALLAMLGGHLVNGFMFAATHDATAVTEIEACCAIGDRDQRCDSLGVTGFH